MTPEHLRRITFMAQQVEQQRKYVHRMLDINAEFQNSDCAAEDATLHKYADACEALLQAVIADKPEVEILNLHCDVSEAKVAVLQARLDHLHKDYMFAVDVALGRRYE